MTLNKKAIQSSVRRILDPLAGLVLRLGFSPDALTLVGLILSFFAGFQIARGQALSAAIFLLFSGLCDILDGGMARLGGRSSKRGAFLDSTLDRLAEISVYLGLVFLYRGRPTMQILTVLAMTGSLMTSYARARAEGLDIDCKVGLMERPERLVLLILGFLAAPLRLGGFGLLELVVAVLALLTYVTTFQRIAHVLGRTARRGSLRDGEREADAVQEGDGEVFSTSGRQQ
jgi:phosphatidylglycerophosphate synthase